MQDKAPEFYGDSVTQYPFYITTFTTFSAADPWSGGRFTQWSIDNFIMNGGLIGTGEQIESYREELRTQTLGQSPSGTIGITSEDGAYHILPVFMGELWCQQRIKNEDLPALLHRIESPLLLRYYESFRRSVLQMLGWGFGVLAMLCLLVGILILTLTSKSDVGELVFYYAVVFLCLGPIQLFLMRRNEKRLTREIERAGKMPG